MIITEDTVAEFVTGAGEPYVFSASGDFGGGYVLLQWGDDDVWTTFADCQFTEDGTHTVTAPTSKVRIVASGAAGPNISANVFPAFESAGSEMVTPAVQEALDEKLDIASKAFLADARGGTDDSRYLTPRKVVEEIATHAQQKPSLLPKTLARWTPRDSLRIAVMGDSFAYYGVPMKQLWRDLGYGGAFANDTVTLAGGASLIDGSAYYPGGSIISIPAGGSALFPGSNASGTMIPIMGTILKGYYVARNGGGSFKLQADKSGSGTFTDVSGYTSVSSDNGSTAIPVAVNADMGNPDYYRTKVVGVSGTTYILYFNTVEKYISTTGRAGNANYLNFALGGSTPTGWLTSAAACWNAVLQDYDPHLVTISSLETLFDWQTYLPTVIARLRVAAPNADILICGQPPSADGELATNDVPINNFLRSYCQANGILFVDTHGAFPNRTVRTMTDGSITSGSKNFSSATANLTSADVGKTIEGAGLNPDTTIATVTGSTTGSFSANATATATGVTLKIGDAPAGFYAWPPHLSTAGVALENSIVYDCIKPTLHSAIGAAYNGVMALPGLFGPNSSGTQSDTWTIVNPEGSKFTRLRLAYGSGGNTSNYYQRGIEAIPPGAAKHGFGIILRNSDGSLSTIFEDAYGKIFSGVYLNDPATITADQNGQAEFVNLGLQDIAPLVASTRASTTANAFEVYKNRSITSSGTLVCAIDAAGNFKLASGQGVYFGSGTPEGSKTAPAGSMYLRSDGGAGTTLYIKEGETGNTGWVAK